MDVLGLDIGTTTISAAVLRDGVPLAARMLKNGAQRPGGQPWERTQDPGQILSTVLAAMEDSLAQFPLVARIGVTGQQHGILYLDRRGNPVSPLYTWQDGRGDLPFCGDVSYAGHLTALTGMPLSTGYGMVTHFYHLKNGLVPQGAVTFCTIQDYVAMVLSGRTAPLLDPTNAASFGLFDVVGRRFDPDALRACGIDTGWLPPLADTPHLGEDRQGRTVFTAIGDNQASFLGATGGAGGMLLNIGTGSQCSIYSQDYLHCEGLETRPFPSGGYLLVGASLCGGRAYALLEQFFRRSAELVLGGPCPPCYDAMSRLLDAAPPPEDVPLVRPLFQGTRRAPQLRGSISGLGLDNFDPLHLMYGMMSGMVEELHEMYQGFLDQGGARPSRLYGSGNGLRKNAHLRQLAAQRFSLPLELSQNEEEAACGAALFAAGP